MESAIITRDILGLPIAVLDESEALSVVQDALIKKTALRLAFVNANLANVAYRDAALHQQLQTFLLLNDGSGMNVASKMLYRKKFPANLNGTDFVPFFLSHCSLKLRIFLLGGSPHVAMNIAKVFEQKWPQHKIVGVQHGFFTTTESADVLNTIKIAQADLVLVAMGNGLQESLVVRLVPDTTASAWGVGALFDFLCDQVPRAPDWMRDSGIEWIFRLCQEPKRLWKRYLIGNFKFMFSVIHQYLRGNSTLDKHSLNRHKND